MADVGLDQPAPSVLAEVSVPACLPAVEVVVLVRRAV